MSESAPQNLNMPVRTAGRTVADIIVRVAGAAGCIVYGVMLLIQNALLFVCGMYGICLFICYFGTAVNAQLSLADFNAQLVLLTHKSARRDGAQT